MSSPLLLTKEGAEAKEAKRLPPFAAHPLLIAVLSVCLLVVGYLWLTPEINNAALAEVMREAIWLPTAVLALLTGALFASSGLLIQTSLDNDFASPSTLGIAAGALLGAVLVRVLVLEASLALIWFGAMSGAVLLSLCVLGVSALVGGGKLPLILIGMALGLGAGAVSSLFLLFFEHQTDGLFIWGSGQVLQTDSQLLGQSLLPICLSLGLTVFILPKLSLFVLGEQQAQLLGLHLKRWRWGILLLAIAQAAIATSVVGMLGFIGLLAPHLSKLWFKSYRLKISLQTQLSGQKQQASEFRLWQIWLLTMLIGAGLVLAAEWGSRMMLFLGYRLPTGALTALIGTPFFLYLLFQPQARALADTEPQHIRFKSLLTGERALGVLLLLCLALLASFWFWLPSLAVMLETSASVELARFGEQHRTFLAASAGIAFAIAGTLLQSLLKNPMASPDISGVSAVAILLIALLLVINPQASQSMVMSCALAGAALISGLLSWGLSKQLSVAQLALFGIVLTAFAGTATQILLTFGSSTTSVTLMWLVGTSYGATWWSWLPIALVLLLAAIILIPRLRVLDLLMLGETMPQSLGVNLHQQRLILLGLTTVITGVSVACIGSISFVGLLAPHCARLLGVRSHAWLLPIAGLTGGILLVWADGVGRTLLAPNEIPAGLMISVLGCVYFLLLLLLGYRR